MPRKKLPKGKCASTLKNLRNTDIEEEAISLESGVDIKSGIFVADFENRLGSIGIPFS